MDAKRNPLLDSGIALAAITAFLYSASSAYTGGFLNQLGLDGDVLERNFQQILYHGFLISFDIFLLAMVGYAIYRFIYSHVVLPELNHELRNNWRRKRFLLRLKHRWWGKRKDPRIVRNEKRYSMTFAVIAAVFFVFISLLVSFEKKGKASAVEIVAKLESKSVNNHDLISVSIDGKARKLLSLICGARNCAGVDPVTKIIYYFPQAGHNYLLPASIKEAGGGNGSR